jgi:hypothetical protein
MPLPDPLLAEACEGSHARFEIRHATLQIETGDLYPCALASPHVV